MWLRQQHSSPWTAGETSFSSRHPHAIPRTSPSCYWATKWTSNRAPFPPNAHNNGARPRTAYPTSRHPRRKPSTSSRRSSASHAMRSASRISPRICTTSSPTRLSSPMRRRRTVVIAARADHPNAYYTHTTNVFDLMQIDNMNEYQIFRFQFFNQCKYLMAKDEFVYNRTRAVVRSHTFFRRSAFVTLGRTLEIEVYLILLLLLLILLKKVSLYIYYK